MVLTPTNPLHPLYELLSRGIYGYFSGVPATQAAVIAQLNSLGYKIDRVFDDPNTSFQAWGLVANDGSRPPVLVSLGSTDTKDAIADANPQGAGANQFTANKATVKNWLTEIVNDNTKNPAGLKVDFTGQSLGGALSQWFASAFPQLMGEAVTFQSPGIATVASKSFISNGGQPSQITHYVVNGDIVSLSGAAFLPGTLRVGDYQTAAFDPEKFTDKHSAGILNNNLPGANATVTNELAVALSDFNRPTFTFSGQDWQDFITKLKQNNPLLGVAIERRVGAELLRVESGNANTLVGAIVQAVSSPTPNPHQPQAIDSLIQQVGSIPGLTKIVERLFAPNLNASAGLAQTSASGNIQDLVLAVTKLPAPLAERAIDSKAPAALAGYPIDLAPDYGRSQQLGLLLNSSAGDSNYLALANSGDLCGWVGEINYLGTSAERLDLSQLFGSNGVGSEGACDPNNLAAAGGVPTDRLGIAGAIV